MRSKNNNKKMYIKNCQRIKQFPKFYAREMNFSLKSANISPIHIYNFTL